MVQLQHDIDVLLLGKLLLACSPQNRLQYTDNMVARGAAAIATVASFIAATRVCVCVCTVPDPDVKRVQVGGIHSASS